MIADVIKFILSNYFVTFLVMGLLGGAFSLFLHREKATQARAFEAFLAYYCLFTVGVNHLYNFIMHVFFGQMAAAFIGWPDSPFQTEVGFASLGFGVVGLLAFRRDFGLRLAAITGPAFFLWGAAGGHLYQMAAHHNFSPGNAGFVFWSDVLTPFIGFFFLFGTRMCDSPHAKE